MKVEKLIDLVQIDEMANVDKRRTGIDVVLHFSAQPTVGHWISVKAQAKPGKINPKEWVELKVNGPSENKIEVVGKNLLTPKYLKDIKKFIVINYKAIKDYWTGKIQITDDFLNKLKKIDE